MMSVNKWTTLESLVMSAEGVRQVSCRSLRQKDRAYI